MSREERLSDELFIKYLDPTKVENDGEDYVRFLRAICDAIAEVSLEG